MIRFFLEKHMSILHVNCVVNGPSNSKEKYINVTYLKELSIN